MSLIPENIGLIIYTSLGALILYLFGQPAKADFLHDRFPEWKKSPLKALTEFLLYVVLGGLLALILAGPDTIRQAVMSGMAWPALLNVTERKRKYNE